MVELDDFGIIKIVGGDFGEVHHYNCPDREIRGHYGADSIRLREFSNFINIDGGKAGGADYHVDLLLAARRMAGIAALATEKSTSTSGF